MTLAAAIPLRGGMVNLGGDGQLVIGGLIGALSPLVLAGSRRARRCSGTSRSRRSARGLYAALAAWGEVAARRPDADLEPAAELPGGRRDVLSRALSPSRRFDRAAADR